jgi:hypothetical protein
MANTYTSLHYHFTFSTKNRLPWIKAEIEAKDWACLGGIARNNKMKPRCVQASLRDAKRRVGNGRPWVKTHGYRQMSLRDEALRAAPRQMTVGRPFKSDDPIISIRALVGNPRRQAIPLHIRPSI